jgi:Tfp pilus assembly protein PilX
MKKQNNLDKKESGAVLVIVLLITLLLLVAGGAILATTSSFSGEVSDMNSEQQAYFAAESGIQTALNVMRGNVAPNPLVNPTPSNALNKISFRSAVTLATSNNPTDTSTIPRLSRWITYTNDKALIGPNTNLGFKLEIIDPDNTVVTSQPSRLLIRSTGIVLGGASKSLEIILQNSGGANLSAPSPLVLDGPSNGFYFEPGSSNTYLINGYDASDPTAPPLPPIGVTNNSNLGVVNSDYRSDQFVPNPPGSQNVASNLPSWLQNPTNLNSRVQELRTYSQSQGRYFTSSTVSNTMNLGSSANPLITFVDGDLTLSSNGTSNGAGILVVTGELTLSGGFSYSGIILVTGSQGARIRGGGGGTIAGFMVIAPYDPNHLSDGFSSPHYDRSGGGNSNLIYDSSAISNANNVLGSVKVVSVGEK